MRQGQQNKRLRGRNRKGPNPLTRSYESNGPDVKIRGTALHVAEKYFQLARDAHSSGDRVMEQRYLQHAEHYFRIVAAAQAQIPLHQQQPQNMPQMGRDDDDGDDMGQMGGPTNGNPMQRYSGEGDQPNLGSDQQSYANGNGSGHDEDDEDEDDDQQPQLEGADRDAEKGDFAGQNQPGGPRLRRRRQNRGRGRREPGDQPQAGVARETVSSDD